MEGMFDKCLFVLRNLSSLLERLCALQSRVFDRFFEAAEIAKFTSREFGEHWENLKSFRDWYSVMSTQLKKGREEDLKEGSPDKPGGLSIQLCKSEKKEFYIRYSS